ncbi:hypothetical protein V8C86DRAFT_2850093 [Haematococcus lacustris]
MHVAKPGSRAGCTSQRSNSSSAPVLDCRAPRLHIALLAPQPSWGTGRLSSHVTQASSTAADIVRWQRESSSRFEFTSHLLYVRDRQQLLQGDQRTTQCLKLLADVGSKDLKELTARLTDTQELFAQLVASLVPLAASLDSSQLLDCLAALALPLALSAGTPPPASLVERASKGRINAAAQSKLAAAEAHHGLLHHTRRLLLAALPRALRDATPRRLMALLHSLQELQPELRLQPGVRVQVVQLLVQGLVSTHRRFLSDCSAKELVELAALLQASPDWRQHVTPGLVQGLQAALRRTVLAKANPAPAAKGVLIRHSSTPAATTSQELTVLPNQVPAAAQLTSFLMALPQALQPVPQYLVALGTAVLRAAVHHKALSEPVLVMALSLLASPSFHTLGLEAKQGVVELVCQALLHKPSLQDGEGDKQAQPLTPSQTKAAAAAVKLEPGSAAAKAAQQPWPAVSCPSCAALLARLGRVCAAQPGLHLAPQLLPAVAAHVVAAKQAQQPGTGQQAGRELEGVVMQQAVQLGSLAIPTAAQLSTLLLISDKRSLEVAVKQLVTQLTAQKEAAAAAATVLLLDWQEHGEEAVRQSELDTLLQLPRLAAVVGQPLGGTLQPVFESQLVQLSHGSSGGTTKAQQLLFENTDRFQQVLLPMMRSGSFPKEVALVDICMPSYEVLAQKVDVSDLVLLLQGMAASGWGGASLMFDRVMVASLRAVARCQAGEVASFMRAVAGLATAPRTDLKLSRRPGVLYDTVGSLRTPSPQDWLEAVQAQVQPWLPHMDSLSAEDRSWLLSCLALDLQAQLPDAFLYQMLAPLAAHANNTTLKRCSPSTLVRLLQLVQHTSRAPASHAWSAKLLAAVELRLLLKRPPQRRNPMAEDIAGEASLSWCIATALDCLPAFTSTGLRLLNPAHGQEQSGQGPMPPTAAQEGVEQAGGGVGQGQKADICRAARGLGLGLALACLKRRHVKHVVLVPDLLAKTVFALRQLEVKPPLVWLKEFEQVATSLVPSMSAPLLARCLVSLHLLGHTPSLLLVDMAAKVLRQSLEGMAAAHPVDLALGLAGLYAALADPQRAHQDSAGQQVESIAQTVRLLAKAWLPCHKTKPDLLLALPRAELLLVSQALQAMLCSPNAAKQGASQVLMAVADGGVGLAKSQALAALTPDSVWLVRWAQAMDVQQAAQAVNRSPDNQTSSKTASKEEAFSMPPQSIAHDASSSEEEGEEGEGSSVPSPGAGATDGVERLSPPSAVQVAHVALDTAITVAPLSLGPNVAWPKPLVALVKDSFGVLAAQLEQGSMVDADMAVVEQYVRSLAQPLEGELPTSFMEAYVGRAMQDLGSAVTALEFVIDLRLVLQARTLKQQITNLVQQLASTSSFDAGGLHQLAALVTYLPLVRVQDEPSSPTWCWREVKLQLQPAVLHCLHGYTVTSGLLGEEGAVQAVTLDLPTCLALCSCAAFVTSEPLAASAQGLPGHHLAQATAPGSLPGTAEPDQSGSLALPRQLASEEAGGQDSSQLTRATLETGILQLPPQVTLALTCVLKQLRDFALTLQNEKSGMAASTTAAAAGSSGRSALHQQLQALGWAHALTLTLPVSPAGASQEQRQAATQNALLDLPSFADCVAWPGAIPVKQVAALIDLQQLAKLQAASHTDHQAELCRLHLHLAQVCHAWYADEVLISLSHHPSGNIRDAQQGLQGPWCMQLVIACSQDTEFNARPELLELLMLSGALQQLHQALSEELRATGGSTKPGPAAARRTPDRHSSRKSGSSGAKPRTTAKASSPQAFNLQQASATVSTLLRLAWEDGALHQYTAREDIGSIIGFLQITAYMLPLLAPPQQPGQDEDWAAALSPLGTEPEAVQALRCLMMDQVMGCAVQLALSLQQPGSHSELSGTAQQGQPQSLNADTVLLVLEALGGLGLLAPPLLQRHVPDNPLSVEPVPPAATQASAPTTDYQVQQHLEAAARAAELEEGGRERGSAAQLAAWPPGLRDQVQAQLLCSQAWPAGWVSVVDALVGHVCADIAHTPELLMAPHLEIMLGELQAAGYAPAQGVAKALLALLALPSAPRLSLSLKTTLVLLVYGVVREPHSLQELDQVLDQQARLRLQEAHVKELFTAESWEEVWAVPCLAVTTRPSPTGSWPESLTECTSWASKVSLGSRHAKCCKYTNDEGLAPRNVWILLRRTVLGQVGVIDEEDIMLYAGSASRTVAPLQSWNQLLPKQLTACANTLYGWREEVELLRGSVLMITAQKKISGTVNAPLAKCKVLAAQLAGRCSQYLPASHFFQVLGTLYLMSCSLPQHSATFAMTGRIPALPHQPPILYDGVCFAGPEPTETDITKLGTWQHALEAMKPGSMMHQQGQQPFCLVPPSAINSLLQLGLRALDSEHGGSSNGGDAVGAAGAAGMLEGGFAGEGQESFITMLFNGGPHVVGRYDSFWRASLLYAVAKRHPEAEAGLVKQALERLMAAASTALASGDELMPLEALLVVVEPHLSPASPTTSPAPLPEELPIKAWLQMADWSWLLGSKLRAGKVDMDSDGSTAPDEYSWGAGQWTQLLSLWINCPPFKILFLQCLAEHHQRMVPKDLVANERSSSTSSGEEGSQAVLKPELGAAVAASGVEGQAEEEGHQQLDPQALHSGSADLTGPHEAELELALALLRMGLHSNLFEGGAPLQPDLQQRLVQWGRWEWYARFLAAARQGQMSNMTPSTSSEAGLQPLAQAEAAGQQTSHNDDMLPSLQAGQAAAAATSSSSSHQAEQHRSESEQPVSSQHSASVGFSNSDGASTAQEAPQQWASFAASASDADMLASGDLAVLVYFALQCEADSLEGLQVPESVSHLPEDPEPPTSLPVNPDDKQDAEANGATIEAQRRASSWLLQQLLCGTVSSLLRLIDSTDLKATFSAAALHLVTNQRKLLGAYEVPQDRDGLKGAGRNPAGGPGPRWGAPGSPAAFKGDVSLVVGVEFLMRCSYAKLKRDAASVGLGIATDVMSGLSASSSRKVGPLAKGWSVAPGQAAAKASAKKKSKQASRKKKG